MVTYSKPKEVLLSVDENGPPLTKPLRIQICLFQYIVHLYSQMLLCFILTRMLASLHGVLL